jgi:hypothetical protein
MPGRVAGGISFRFHNAPAEATLWKLVDNYFSNKEAGQFDGIGGKFSSAEPANREFLQFAFWSDLI